jgi:hypothetical protein
VCNKKKVCKNHLPSHKSFRRFVHSFSSAFCYFFLVPAYSLFTFLFLKYKIFVFGLFFYIIFFLFRINLNKKLCIPFVYVYEDVYTYLKWFEKAVSLEILLFGRRTWISVVCWNYDELVNHWHIFNRLH